MTVPRDWSVLSRLSQISLAIHSSPSAQPVKKRSTSHPSKPGSRGMTNIIAVQIPMPRMIAGRRPRRAMAPGYNGPHSMTASVLTLVTAPISKLEAPPRSRTSDIKGG